MSNEKEGSDGAIHNKNHKCKENESFKLIKKLKGDAKKAGMTCNMLERKSVCVEEHYEKLVKKLKIKLCRVMFLKQEEEFLKVDDIRKSIDDEFVVDARLEHLEEHDEDEESEEDMENDEDLSSEEMMESEKEIEHEEMECEESEHEESEENDECECRDSLGRMFDGQCLKDAH